MESKPCKGILVGGLLLRIFLGYNLILYKNFTLIFFCLLTIVEDNVNLLTNGEILRHLVK